MHGAFRGDKTATSFLISRLRAGYAYLAMFLGLIALLLICLSGLPIALLLICLPASIRVPLGRRLISVSLTAYLDFLKVFCSVRIDFSGLDCVHQEGPMIVIANHPSLLDALILLSRMPRAVCVMKGSLARNPLFGPMARLAGYVSNDDTMGLVRQSCTQLAAGGQLLIFPEGTRTRAFPFNPFSEAAAFIAARSGVSVQTLLIEFSSPYLGKAWPLFKKPTLPLCVAVKSGKRFSPDRDRLALTQRLESYYRLNLERGGEQWRS